MLSPQNPLGFPPQRGRGRKALARGLLGLAALSVGLSSAPASDTVTCHTNASYVVIEGKNEDSGGHKYLVQTKATPDAKISCDYKPAKGDFEIDGSDDAYYFLGLRDHILVLDGGTSPVRSLYIYDLKNWSKIFEATMSREDLVVSEQGVSFWMQTDKGTPRNCKKYKQYAKDLLNAAIETYSTYDFATAEIHKSDETRCIPVK